MGVVFVIVGDCVCYCGGVVCVIVGMLCLLLRGLCLLLCGGCVCNHGLSFLFVCWILIMLFKKGLVRFEIGASSDVVCTNLRLVY